MTCDENIYLMKAEESLAGTEIVEELKGIVKKRYPEAQFQMTHSFNRKVIYIDAYTDAEDILDVLELTSARQLDILLEEGFALHVTSLELHLATEEIERLRKLYLSKPT